MEVFSYHNIFDTKGLEYLIIIAFLALLVPFSIILNRKVKSKKLRQGAGGNLSDGVAQIPQGVFLGHNHTWAHLAKSGMAHVGLDDLLLHFTGDVRLTCLKGNGASISKGEVMAEIEQQGKMLKIVSPISGVISANNPVLSEDPGMLTEDPYGAGWLYRIKPSKWKAETNPYYLAESATEWSKRELERFRDFLAVTLPKYSPEASMVVLQDGGVLRDHILSELPGELWGDFQEEFLKLK